MNYILHLTNLPFGAIRFYRPIVRFECEYLINAEQLAAVGARILNQLSVTGITHQPVGVPVATRLEHFICVAIGDNGLVLLLCIALVAVSGSRERIPRLGFRPIASSTHPPTAQTTRGVLSPRAIRGRTPVQARIAL